MTRRRGRRGAMSAPAFPSTGSAARAEFYAAACDPARSCAGEGCAGAGTTWILVSRVSAPCSPAPAARDPRDHLHPQGGRRDARPPERVALRFAGPPRPRPGRALVQRGVGRAGARRSPRARRLCTGVCGRPAGGEPDLSRMVIAAAAGRAAVIARPPRSAPEMELMEDFTDLCRRLYAFHGAVVRDPGLRADYAAMTARRGGHQLRKWLDAAWWQAGRVRSGRPGRVPDESVSRGRALGRGGARGPSGGGIAASSARRAAPWRRAQGRAQDAAGVGSRDRRGGCAGGVRGLLRPRCRRSSRTRARPGR